MPGQEESMSGGRFDYAQRHILDIAHSLGGILRSPEEYGIKNPEVRAEAAKGLLFQRLAYIYAQRLDMLVSGVDDEESFLRLLREDLETPWQYCADCGFVTVADASGSECQECGAGGGHGLIFGELP
jgi:hypothetical protein